MNTSIILLENSVHFSSSEICFKVAISVGENVYRIGFHTTSSLFPHLALCPILLHSDQQKSCVLLSFCLLHLLSEKLYDF